MKTKPLVLGSLAFTVAMGSAFASTSFAKRPWIEVLFWGAPNYMCVDTDLWCGNDGAVTCTLYVYTMTGVTIVAGSDIGCVFPLSENSTQPVGLYYPPNGAVIMDAR